MRMPFMIFTTIVTSFKNTLPSPAEGIFLKKNFQKNGIHICVDYAQNHDRYRYLTKA